MGWKDVVDAWRTPLPTCGSLDMAFERGVFTPGDIITGTVLLKVDTPVNDAELSLWLRCDERLRAKYSDSEGTVKEKKEHTIANLKFVLSPSSPVVSDLNVPFRIQIPLGLPETTELTYASETGGLEANLSVVYTLTAKLIVRESGFGSSEHAVLIRVLPPPTARSIGKTVEQSVSKNFDYACWFKKSFCNVRVQLDTDVFSLGSTVSARVWLGTATPERLKWITLSLVRCINRNSDSVNMNHRDHQAIRSIRFTRAHLGDATKFILRLEVLSVATEHERDPLKPTSSYFHVGISYLVEVTTKMKGTRRITVGIPVKVEPPDIVVTSAQ